MSALSWLRHLQEEKGEQYLLSRFLFTSKWCKVFVYVESCGQLWEERMDTMDAASWSTAREANCDRNSPVSMHSHSLVLGSCISQCCRIGLGFLFEFHTALLSGPIPIPTACAHVSFGTRTQTIEVKHLASFSLFAVVLLSGKGPRGRRERRNKPELPKKWLAAFLLRTTRTMAGYPWAPILDRLWGLRYFALY